MIKSYTGTLFHTQDLNKATIEVLVYDKPKYEVTEPTDRKITYTGVTSWDIITGGKEAEELESETDGSCIDDNHEYLVLHFEDGTQATFRNSYVSMFIW